ncbi:MAG: tripartite tricarboxylate transporter substrate binding protein, partial [Porphyromonadaceae bacterium]|nr:tripartite tricarboxylate transporter substrate binding protein [Porphyromonadaceae bacterium]
MSKCKKVIVGILTVTLLFSIALTGCSKSSSTDSNSKSKNTGTAIDYPTKPVNMIIAFSAGGSSDVQARIMQKYWNKYVPKQPWVFNYKAGAGGAVGFAEIAHAKADGYTIGGVNVPHIVLQPLGQGAQYSVDDFAYLCQAVQDPQVLAVNKDSKFNTWQEVIDYAKANPEKLKCGLVGTYTGTHLMLLELEDLTGAKMTQVVYKGASDQNAALMGGELD